MRLKSGVSLILCLGLWLALISCEETKKEVPSGPKILFTLSSDTSLFDVHKGMGEPLAEFSHRTLKDSTFADFFKDGSPDLWFVFENEKRDSGFTQTLKLKNLNPNLDVAYVQMQEEMRICPAKTPYFDTLIYPSGSRDSSYCDSPSKLHQRTTHYFSPIVFYESDRITDEQGWLNLDQLLLKSETKTKNGIRTITIKGAWTEGYLRGIEEGYLVVRVSGKNGYRYGWVKISTDFLSFTLHAYALQKQSS